MAWPMMDCSDNKFGQIINRGEADPDRLATPVLGGVFCHHGGFHVHQKLIWPRNTLPVTNVEVRETIRMKPSKSA